MLSTKLPEMIKLTKSAGRLPAALLMASMVIASAAETPQYQVRLPFKGVKAVAAPSSASVSLSATALSFGEVELGKPATRSLTVTNSGEAAAAVNEIRVTASEALFTRTHDCGTSLAGNATCKIDVTFNPVAQEDVTGALRVAIAGTDQLITLSGKGVAPVANASTWTPLTLPVSGYWRDISYGNGTFVTTNVDIGSTVITSKDGISWQAGSMPKSGAWATTYGADKFVAVGWGSGGPWSATSTDGKAWSSGGALPTGYTWEHVTYANGVYVAISQTPYPYTGLGAVARSTDGVTWTKVPLPLDIQYLNIAAGSGKFVLIGNGNQSLTSTDGLTWTRVTMPVSGLWISVTYGNGRFVAVAQGSSNASAVSTDGINWTRGTLPAQFSAGDVIYGNGKFVASGTSGKTLQSTDGLTWSENTMPSASVWYALGFGNGTFVTLGNNSNRGAYTQ